MDFRVKSNRPAHFIAFIHNLPDVISHLHKSIYSEERLKFHILSELVQYRSCYQRVQSIGQYSHMILSRTPPYGQLWVRGRWISAAIMEPELEMS